MKELESLSKKVSHEIQSVIGVGCRIKLVEPKLSSVRRARLKGLQTTGIFKEVFIYESQQISVFIENRTEDSARLQRPGKNGVNIRALALAETTDYGYSG